VENIHNIRKKRRFEMAKYLVFFKYKPEGLKGLMAEGGSKRRLATEQLVKSLGGKLEAYYFTFGEEDGFAIADLPDNVSAAASSLVPSASGAVSTKVIVLLTPEEVDQAVKRSATYRPPGK
jgi:uncharacterized protein with GYD domain